ncbi:MAG TPA: hypothetical protein VMT17_07340 [Anaeromyxobacteraceae bacterium]|nr:hypothetical protein [Anaeromyxobacteraceae bacterium]
MPDVPRVQIAISLAQLDGSCRGARGAHAPLLGVQRPGEPASRAADWLVGTPPLGEGSRSRRDPGGAA